MRRLLIAVAILVLVPGVAYAGGGGVDTSGCAGYSEGATVSMRDSCFAGTAHFAPSDSPIVVSNEGALPHTFTAVDGSFDTGQLAPGTSTELVFDEPGIYRVFCALHGTAAGEGMAGVVVVGEAVPASVTAPMDTSAIREAVAAESAAVVDAIEGQRSTIRGLGATEAKLLVALDQIGSPEEETSPQIVTASDGIATDRMLVLVLVGLATGLAMATLLTVLRLRLAQPSGARLDRLDPAAGS